MDNLKDEKDEDILGLFKKAIILLVYMLMLDLILMKLYLNKL